MIELMKNLPDRRFICDTIGDFVGLPNQVDPGICGELVAAGSRAIAVKDIKLYVLAPEGTWVDWSL